MKLRDPRVVAGVRVVTTLAMIAGVVLTASGPATATGLLPYFTIQSNIGVGVFAGWAAVRAWRGDLTTPAVLKGALTLYIVITGLVFHLVLANPASPFWMGVAHRTPGEAVGNQLLHTVVPLLAVLDWLLFDERRRYRWRDAALWLAYPLAYLGFALVRGLITHTYPYPFLDVHKLGYGGLAVTAVFFAIGFWLLGLLLVAIDRVPARRRTPVRSG